MAYFQLMASTPNYLCGGDRRYLPSFQGLPLKDGGHLPNGRVLIWREKSIYPSQVFVFVNCHVELVEWVFFWVKCLGWRVLIRPGYKTGISEAYNIQYAI